MEKNDRFSFLLQQYTSGNISDDEQDELFELLSTSQFDSDLSSMIQKELQKRDNVIHAPINFYERGDFAKQLVKDFIKGSEIGKNDNRRENG